MFDIKDKGNKKIIILLSAVLISIIAFTVLCAVFLSKAASIINEENTVTEIGRADIMNVETQSNGPIYFLCERNGMIAVFSEDNVLIEYLDVAVITLPRKDRDQIRLGIRIHGTENLEKIKQDYSN